MQDRLLHFIRLSLPYIAKYRYLIIGLIVIGVYGFAVLRIDSVIQTKRDEESFAAQQAEIKKIQFDEAAAEEIRNLERSSAEIQADIDENRRNPFQ